ncbi:MAG TPA: DUF3365 domain-containing protein [Candidatus Competibacteraceae bacterium]|nr:DUF3365 domain-containing protein [Candidatus Competibacteraceae bacterium]MCP5133769.1 DUF3365 domain-containing protein [Gammaproteobacteria bacterium]HPF58056.1 DUF3365 domain-containing protein [Candidatus Competibacteraceae bacterium]HRY18985.1 DUF3365 domain-containing protein [Candidatus Competibacteraceae bacterium]
MFSKWSIQLKYSLTFILTLALIIAGLFIGIYKLKTTQLRNEAMASAEQVIAFRAWVANTGVVWVDHLAPGFRDFLGKRTNNDNTMEFFSKNPALATRELSEIVSKTATRATFRVTSDEYRNPSNAPDHFESDSIQAFKANQDVKYNEAFENNFYRYSQPILVKESCLKCHGDPKDAPADVIAKYGDKRAFGYKVGDVRGIISVKLPDITLIDVLLTFLNPYTLGLIILAFLLNFLYTQQSIITRLKKLAQTTERIAQGELDLPLQENPGSRDEVDHVQHAVGLLRNSVVVAMKRLQKTLS